MLHEEFHNSISRSIWWPSRSPDGADRWRDRAGGDRLAYVGVSPLGPYAADLTWAALLGALGGLLSALRTLTRSAARKIPAHLAGWPVTLVRPVIGAVAGIAAWLIIATGVVTVVAELKQLAPLVAAFFAGFSERYFLSLVPGAEKRADASS